MATKKAATQPEPKPDKTYKAVRAFTDMADPKKRVYRAGDTYPDEGFEPTDERIAGLLSVSNGQGVPVIAED